MSLGFTGAVLALVASMGVAARLHAEGTREGLALLADVVSTAIRFGMWLSASRWLPHRGTGWRGLAPGALLVALGIQAFYVFTTWFLVPKLSSAPPGGGPPARGLGGGTAPCQRGPRPGACGTGATRGRPERERLHYVRRQATEHARRTDQRRRDDARRYQEAAWVSEFLQEGPAVRHELRFDGPLVTPEVLDALWDLLAPRDGQDVHETVEVTRGQWASGMTSTSGIDGMPLTGLEHATPGTYRFAGRGALGLYGGARGDHYVTVVHVDDLGRPVPGGFRDRQASKPAGGNGAKRPPGRHDPSPSTRGVVAPVSGAARFLVTLTKWALVLPAVMVAVVVVVLVMVMPVRR